MTVQVVCCLVCQGKQVFGLLVLSRQKKVSVGLFAKANNKLVFLRLAKQNPACAVLLLVIAEQPMRTLIFCIFILQACLLRAQPCETQSGPTLRPLIELYTSEGCSSCPPADRWLSTLKPRVTANELSAATFHVDYWDQLGWQDPFALPESSGRQRWLAARSTAQVYTPGVFANGREWRDWQLGQLPVPSASAPWMHMRFDARAGTLVIKVSALSAPARLIVLDQALNQRSRVARGENSGRTLVHDFSVRSMQEFPLAAEKAAERTVTMPVRTASSALLAFVQHADGRVLQSAQLMLTNAQGACASQAD
jgi:hypothetical protein